MDWIGFLKKNAMRFFPNIILGKLRHIRLKMSCANLHLGKNYEVYQVAFGRNVKISNNVRLYRALVDDYSYVGSGTKIQDAELGKFCSIAEEVCVGLGAHPSKKYVSTHPLFYLSRPEAGWRLSVKDTFHEFKKTVIGNDVWIGYRAIIRCGVTIGNGAIIGAGAVVVSDVEPYAIYGGVPAKLIRYRFSSAQIELLEEIKWWLNDDAWLQQHVEYMQDIEKFLTKLVAIKSNAQEKNN